GGVVVLEDQVLHLVGGEGVVVGVLAGVDAVGVEVVFVEPEQAAFDERGEAGDDRCGMGDVGCGMCGGAADFGAGGVAVAGGGGSGGGLRWGWGRRWRGSRGTPGRWGRPCGLRSFGWWRRCRPRRL